MFNIEEELKKLPNKPGVYVMRDKNDTIIYVGKAISLKNRVRQYFRKNNKTARIEKMVSLIDHFEYIVVDNEAEALILECNLIKKNRPKFNVLLKDDKTYPYIKIDVKSDYPGVFITRRVINDGSKYFGPYANPGAAKEMIDFIKQKYKIRQCRTLKNRERPCLNYHINRCLAPCMGYVTPQEYKKQIDEIIDLLEGKTDRILKELDKQMQEASEKLDFEKAAELRDRKLAIERASSKQKVSNISENNIDVIGLYKSELEVCIEIFFVRGSKMIGREHYFFPELKDMEDSEILSGFIKQYYLENPNIPSKIMLREELPEKEVIEHIQRRVGLDIAYGIAIVVNDKTLVGNNIVLIDNEEINPIKEEYQDGEINVKILSGIAPREGKTYPPEKAGWYIYCNGRLVVAADKTSLTTWKDMENKSSGIVFHNNYAGFRGIVYFSSKHPEKLPWNTTKTGLDETSLVYLRAREKMLEIFKIVKNILDDVRKNTEVEDDGIEETIAQMHGTEMTIENVNKVKENRVVSIKNVSVITVPNVTINYKKPKEEAEELKKVLGVKSYREVGEKTFEYYKDAEC